MVTDNKSTNQEVEKPVDESEFLDDIFAGGGDIEDVDLEDDPEDYDDDEDDSDFDPDDFGYDEDDYEDEDDDLEGDDDTF